MIKHISHPLAITAIGAFLLSGHTAAKAELSEKEILKQCEMSLCELIVKKQADGGNLACDLVKTWGKKELQAGASQTKLMKWSWGDARCETKIDLDRGPLLQALNDPKYDLKLAPTPVNCTIGGGKKAEVSFTLAPQLGFEAGHVKTAKLGISDIRGSFLKRMVLKSAQLIDKSKALNGVIAKEVNKFIHEQCPKKVQ